MKVNFIVRFFALILVWSIFAIPQMLLAQDEDKSIDKFIHDIRLEAQYKALPEDARRLAREATWYMLNWHQDMEYLKRSIEKCEEILKICPADELAHCGLMYSYYWLGVFEKDMASKAKAFQGALNIAEKNIRLNRASFWPRYFSFLCKVELSRKQSAFKSLGALKDLKKELRTLTTEHPDRSPTWLVNGCFLTDLPAVLGGNLNEAILSLNKAIKMEPNFTRSYLELAEAYCKKKQYAQARLVLEKLLAVKAPIYPSDYLQFDAPRGKKLLGEIDKG